MLISFYHITLCPRCAHVRKQLVRMLGDDYQSTIVEINVLTAPLSTFREGIRMVPALKYGQDILSGLTLSDRAIVHFLEKHTNSQSA